MQLESGMQTQTLSQILDEVRAIGRSTQTLKRDTRALLAYPLSSVRCLRILYS